MNTSLPAESAVSIQARRMPSVAMPSLQDLLRFERVLADLSAQFITLAPDRVEGEIEVALRAIVEVLDLDRCTISRFRADDGTYGHSYSWVRPGLSPASVGDLTQKYPWVIARILSGDGVVVSSLDELPAEAHVDRASFQRTCVRSHVSVPLNVGGHVDGALSFATIRHEHAWPADLLVRLRLVAEIFGNALARKGTQEKLEELLGFERLLADIAATLVPLTTGAVDDAIVLGLKRLAAFFDLDRTTLWALEFDDAGLRPTHCWSADATRELPNLNAVTMPWMFATIRANEHVRIGRVDALPIEAETEKVTLMALGTRSVLMVPLSVGGAVIGALSLATIRRVRDWPQEFVPRIRLVGEVLAAAVRAEHDRAALTHMTRVSVLGQLSASIAHQLNQPLTAILTNAETAQRMLARDPVDMTELRDICDDIVSENHRAAEVIVRLRALFKRNELRVQRVGLNELIRETIDLLRTELVLQQVKLTTALAPALPDVNGDRVQLQQVLLNLIVNAAEALNANVGKQRLLCVHTEATDAGARVCVIDNGPGIDEGKLKHVFDPFWSTKPGGMGIGLAICRSILVAHGGGLTAANNVGGGASFCAMLPARS
ncbi:MAG: GAF domain-containing protein [Proteobacteria bacterium]|nr:GAF domain-containing protein [Burkholderiales bacterium]